LIPRGAHLPAPNYDRPDWTVAGVATVVLASGAVTATRPPLQRSRDELGNRPDMSVTPSVIAGVKRSVSGDLENALRLDRYPASQPDFAFFDWRQERR